MRSLTIFLMISIFTQTERLCQNLQKVSKAVSIFQYSTLSALLEGLYVGTMTIGELKKHGDFGIGTFNALDGELILFEGRCFKATSDSKILPMNDSVRSLLLPFATSKPIP